MPTIINRAGGAGAHEVAQQFERLAARPVQVVEQHQQRRLTRRRSASTRSTAENNR